jgi:hypothetical protein
MRHLGSANVGPRVGFLRQRRTRGIEHHAFRPFLIRMDSDVDFRIERNVRTIGAEQHQFAAKSAATRKLPTHPKYCNNGMVTVSAPVGR